MSADVSLLGRLDYQAWKMNLRLFIYIGLFCFVLREASCLDNPYKILGVDKKSSLAEIKKAYKQLAKEWLVEENFMKFCEKKLSISG